MGLIKKRSTLSAEEKFGFSLNRDELDSFAKRIGVEGIVSIPPSLVALGKVISAFLGNIPFHNLSLLTRGRRSPTISEIKRDMLSGLGGPCGHMNPFLGAFLHGLDYRIHLVSGSMMQPNCHLALLVHLPEGRFYCDVGDGRPYFYPMAADRLQEHHHPSYTWKTYPLSENQLALDVLHEDGWSRNCTVDLDEKPFSFFTNFIYCHYSKDDYGPFQRGFRLVQYPMGAVKGIRDLEYLYQENGQFFRREIGSKKEFMELTGQFPSVPTELVEESCAELAKRGIEGFDRMFN